METNATSLDPRIIAALIAASVSLVTGCLTAIITSRVTVTRLRREFLLEMRAESLVRKLLAHRKWRFRTFKTLKHYVAGFEDNELRQILIRAGAVRFNDDNGDEIWGLIERVEDLLTAEYGTNDF